MVTEESESIIFLRAFCIFNAKRQKLAWSKQWFNNLREIKTRVERIQRLGVGTTFPNPNCMSRPFFRENSRDLWIRLKSSLEGENLTRSFTDDHTSIMYSYNVRLHWSEKTGWTPIITLTDRNEGKFHFFLALKYHDYDHPPTTISKLTRYLYEAIKM